MNNSFNSLSPLAILALSTSASFSAMTLFSDDFEAAPNPANLFTGPGGAIAPGTWGLANNGPQNEVEAAAVNSYSNASRWNGPLPASTYLQLGYARSDATEVTLALMETWSDTMDYRLSFDLANRDNATSTDIVLSANFFGVPLQEWSGVTYLGADQYSAVFKANASDPDAALIHAEDLGALHGSFTSTRLEIVVTGDQIAAANQTGNHIYFSFDKGWNTEHHYVDNVLFEAGSVGEFSTIPEPSTGLLAMVGGIGFVAIRRKRRDR